MHVSKHSCVCVAVVCACSVLCVHCAWWCLLCCTVRCVWDVRFVFRCLWCVCVVCVVCAVWCVCVWSPRVTVQNASVCTHGDVLNLHTGGLSLSFPFLFLLPLFLRSLSRSLLFSRSLSRSPLLSSRSLSLLSARHSFFLCSFLFKKHFLSPISSLCFCSQ